MSVTKNLAGYIDKSRINLSAMSRDTTIPYHVLYDSLKNKSRERPLSADEAVKVCKFLGKKVEDFAGDNKPEGEG